MNPGIISNLEISKDGNRINWNFENEKKHVDIDNVSQAELNKKGGLIFAIAGEKQISSLLHILHGTGKQIKKINCPNGFYFSFISMHPELGQCVVCSTDTPIDDWYDWYFSIDVKRGVLIRQGPSY